MQIKDPISYNKSMFIKTLKIVIYYMFKYRLVGEDLHTTRNTKNLKYISLEWLNVKIVLNN